MMISCDRGGKDRGHNLTHIKTTKYRPYTGVLPAGIEALSKKINELNSRMSHDEMLAYLDIEEPRFSGRLDATLAPIDAKGARGISITTYIINRPFHLAIKEIQFADGKLKCEAFISKEMQKPNVSD